MPNSSLVLSFRKTTIAMVGLTVAGLITFPPNLEAASVKHAAPAAAAKSARPAEEEGGIAAVVNDTVITRADLEGRIRLGLLSSGIPETAEARDHIRSQILRQLIDERLQTQEAKAQNATASDDEINKSMDALAQTNKMNRAQMDKMLAAHGVPMEILRGQVRAMLDWRRLLQRRVQQEVSVSDDEVTAALERRKQDVGKPERLLAEIFLAVDRPQQDAEVHRTADRLLEEIHKSGNFAGIARQFSQSAAASSGGDLGWVRQGELSDEIDTALAQIRPGQVSAPVRSADGYHIILVRAQRVIGSSSPEEDAPAAPPVRQQAPVAPPRPDLAKARVSMKQLIFQASEPTPDAVKAAVAQAETVRKTIRSCGDVDRIAKEMGQGGMSDLGNQAVRDLQPGLQGFAVAYPLGKVSPVMKGSSGALVLIVCKRDVPMIAPPPPKEPPAPKAPPAPMPIAKQTKKDDLKMPTRDEVEQQLVEERAERISRRYLRDLRRAAFIEIRS